MLFIYDKKTICHGVDHMLKGFMSVKSVISYDMCQYLFEEGVF